MRFVGSKKIAKEIMDKNITFEEYLDSIEDVKGTYSAAKYRIEKTLQEFFKETYGDDVINSRFNVTKIYSQEEEKNDEAISSLKLGDKDIAFEVTYQLQPAEGADINLLMVVDGEYDKTLGWVTDINRLGVLKYNQDGTYSITNFGTGW